MVADGAWLEEEGASITDVVRLQLGLSLEKLDALGTVSRIEWTQEEVGRVPTSSGTPLVRLHFDTLARSDSDELYHGARLWNCSLLWRSADRAWRVRDSNVEARAWLPRGRAAPHRPHC